MPKIYLVSCTPIGYKNLQEHNGCHTSVGSIGGIVDLVGVVRQRHRQMVRRKRHKDSILDIKKTKPATQKKGKALKMY